MARTPFQLLLLLFFIAPTAQGQAVEKSSLSIHFTDVSVGRNFNLLYRLPLSDKWAIYGGPKYHVNNQSEQDDDDEFFIKRMYANGREHFGFRLGAERKVLTTPYFKLYAFYDFQYTRATSRRYLYPVVGQNSQGANIYIRVPHQFAPLTSLENNFGINARFDIDKHFYINGYAGAGVALFLYPPYDAVHGTSLPGDGHTIMASRMVGIGVGYSF